MSKNKLFLSALYPYPLNRFGIVAVAQPGFASGGGEGFKKNLIHKRLKMHKQLHNPEMHMHKVCLAAKARRTLETFLRQDSS